MKETLRDEKRISFCSTPNDFDVDFFFSSSSSHPKSKKSKTSSLLSPLLRYVEAEKTHARWAMIGVAGILGQEILGVEPKWFLHGQKDYGKEKQFFFLS